MPQSPAQIKNSGGYALVEIMLAFGIAMIIVVSMVSLAVVTIRASTNTKTYEEAGKLVQGQVERLKLKRDITPWSTFMPSMVTCSGTNTKCSVDSNLSVSTSSISTTGSGITYYFYITDASSDGTSFKYTVVANWSVYGANKVYRVEGVLSDWNAL